MIFKINRTQNKEVLNSVKRVSLASVGWTEKDLEDLISNNIQELIPENQLMILSQERQYQEEADILALDEKGNLYIFELKRWKSNKENILQVLRYGQIFGQYPYEKLQKLYRAKLKNNDANLAEDHYKYFIDSLEEKLHEHDFNKDQVFVVITDGADLDTLDAIQYWKNKGLKLESSPYRVFEIGNEILFEFNKYNPKNDVILDVDTGIYIVNTNIAYSKTNYKEMLNESKAAAYGDKKTSVNKIKKGDKVFLYHTGVGIIACGKAVSNYKVKENNDEEHFIELKFEWKIDPDKEPDKAVKSYEINSTLTTGHRFRSTCFAIDEKMEKAIASLYKP